MLAILVDAVISFALLALVLAGAWQVFVRTPMGISLQQRRNRKRIERGSPLVCPEHGPHAENDLVRLPSGETICPQCYQEVQDAHLY